LGFLSEFFCKALCDTKSLEKLSIGHISQIDSDQFDFLGPVLDGLSSNTSITRFVAKFNKASNPLTPGQDLENCLTLNHSTTVVDLAGALWSPKHVDSVCVGLCVNNTLVTLDISGCYINPEACHAIYGMLSQNKALHQLFLNPIHLEKQEAVALIDSCRFNATLEVLSLVQWSLKSNLNANQLKEPFQFSNHSQINDLIQKIQTIRQEKSEPFLTVCWLVT